MAFGDTIRVRKRGEITLPKPIRDALALDEGTILIANVEGGKLVITPGRVVAELPPLEIPTEVAAEAPE
ncbi:MAG: hypothetical protein DHS20C14_15890 [Phycisphaeraceae bacterium]|nr:MAG: hypothetical protein DHS20C14_15890 [Phycisphaeraceae bacterium]